MDIRTVLDENVDTKYNMNEDELYWLNMWEDFLKNVNKDTKLPGHPIWADCFQGSEDLPGDLEQYSVDELINIGKQWKNYGWVKPVSYEMEKEQLIKAIGLPLWKQNFIRKNRLLYNDNRKFIDKWLRKWRVLK